MHSHKSNIILNSTNCFFKYPEFMLHLFYLALYTYYDFFITPNERLKIHCPKQKHTFSNNFSITLSVKKKLPVLNDILLFLAHTAYVDYCF